MGGTLSASSWPHKLSDLIFFCASRSAGSRIIASSKASRPQQGQCTSALAPPLGVCCKGVVLP